MVGADVVGTAEEEEEEEEEAVPAVVFELVLVVMSAPGAADVGCC